jgi:DNA polymerase-3 subunit beta
MKFVVSSAILSQRLQTIGRVIVPKGTLAVLENILFKVVGNQLTLVAADSEITLTSTLELVDSEGEITFMINAKTIQEAIREIPEQPVDIYVNEENYAVTVEYQNGKFNFVAQSAEEFPLPPVMTEDKVTFSMDSQLLYNGVNRSLFAASNDALRPQIGGLYFDVKEGETAIVATDAQKMACTQYPGVGSSQVGSFILPKKPANMLKGFLVKDEGQTQIEFSMRNAVFTTENYTMNCRLVEGRYPNYAAVIPTANDIIVTANRAAMISALRRVLLFSNVASGCVKLKLENNNMHISSHELDFSKSADESLLCDYNQTPMSIGFRGSFLLEVLNNIEAEDVLLKLAGPSRAGLILPVEQKETETVLMMLMPMMIND